MSGESLRKVVEDAVEEYNRYHSPEATARLISISDDSVIIDFRGPYCRTCGFYDYFEDFRYTLLDHGVKSEMSEVEETEEGAVVTFSVSERKTRSTA
ncbi:MAG: hypothetical protein ACTSSA_07310 [Candidatus Freyarchaeota archaeon]|nr:hypothetical protein [Candidatus Freyarchaeota archaeon]